MWGIRIRCFYRRVKDCERILLFRIFTQNYEWHDSKPGIRVFQTLKVNLNFGEGKFGWMTLWHIIQVSATHRANQSKLGRIMIVHNLEYDGVCSSQGFYFNIKVLTWLVKLSLLGNVCQIECLITPNKQTVVKFIDSSWSYLLDINGNPEQKNDKIANRILTYVHIKGGWNAKKVVLFMVTLLVNIGFR